MEWGHNIYENAKMEIFGEEIFAYSFLMKYFILINDGKWDKMDGWPIG